MKKADLGSWFWTFTVQDQAAPSVWCLMGWWMIGCMHWESQEAQSQEENSGLLSATSW